MPLPVGSSTVNVITRYREENCLWFRLLSLSPYPRFEDRRMMMVRVACCTTDQRWRRVVVGGNPREPVMGGAFKRRILSRCTWLIERQTLISNHRLPGQFHSSRRNRPLRISPRAILRIERPFGSVFFFFDFSFFFLFLSFSFLLLFFLTMILCREKVFVHGLRKRRKDRANVKCIVL